MEVRVDRLYIIEPPYAHGSRNYDLVLHGATKLEITFSAVSEYFVLAGPYEIE